MQDWKCNRTIPVGTASSECGGAVPLSDSGSVCFERGGRTGA